MLTSTNINIRFAGTLIYLRDYAAEIYKSFWIAFKTSQTRIGIDQ